MVVSSNSGFPVGSPVEISVAECSAKGHVVFNDGVVALGLLESGDLEQMASLKELATYWFVGKKAVEHKYPTFEYVESQKDDEVFLAWEVETSRPLSGDGLANKAHYLFNEGEENEYDDLEGFGELGSVVYNDSKVAVVEFCVPYSMGNHVVNKWQVLRQFPEVDASKLSMSGFYVCYDPSTADKISWIDHENVSTLDIVQHMFTSCIYHSNEVVEDLAQIVSDVEELIPVSEEEYTQFEKFGMYPADECVPYLATRRNRFYVFDDRALMDKEKPQEWMCYGDMKFRQLYILYIMASIDHPKAHEWLRDNLFQGDRLVDSKVQAFAYRFRQYIRKDWMDIQVEWLKYCLMLKYRQWPKFRELLHSTSLLPVENVTNKNFTSRLYWGAKSITVDGREYFVGCNMHGKLLKQLRDNNGVLDYHLPDDLRIFGKSVITDF